MINEFGIRLKSARKMAGMSLDALAQKTGGIVTKQAISKYEKGMINPGSEVLLALSRALDIQVDYFFRPAKVFITGLEFRKKSRLSKKAKDRIEFQAIDFLQKYMELEDILNIREAFVNPVSDPVIETYDDIERAARDIRQQWKLGEGPVPHLIELLENKGFKVFEVSDADHFDGLSGFVKGLDIPVVAVHEGQDLVRKRFTLAHELGHLLLDFSKAAPKDTEKLCHAFAGALLLPATVIKKELGEKRTKITQWELKKLKGIYGISIQAIMARAHNLGIVADRFYLSFCIYAKKNGWHKQEPGEYKGKEKANRFEQFVYQAAAEQIISFSKAAEFLNQSLSEFEQKDLFVA